jgi:hypothetical protein
MATTSQSHTGDGSTTNYTLQFQYVKQSDVKITLDGTATTAFTFANATTISFNTAPANGVVIKITRETDLTNISATFFPGSAIKAEDLNDNFEQTLFVSQESNNLASTSSTDVATALSNSSTALSTANSASTTATNALNAVNNVVVYTVVANVSSLPSSPSDGDRVEVSNSTNAETTSSITGLPANFTGAADIILRLQYNSNSANFVFNDYTVQDPDSRYNLLDADTTKNDVANTFSAAQTFTLQTVHNGGLTVDGPYEQTVEAVAALDIDLSAGNYFTKTINSNSVFTFSNPPASGTVGSFTLELTHTSGTVTWPSSVKFPEDTAPTLTTGKTHLFVFVTDDGGTRYRGAALANYVN